MYDHTSSKLANHQIRHQATHTVIAYGHFNLPHGFVYVWANTLSLSPPAAPTYRTTCSEYEWQVASWRFFVLDNKSISTKERDWYTQDLTSLWYCQEIPLLTLHTTNTTLLTYHLASHTDYNTDLASSCLPYLVSWGNCSHLCYVLVVTSPNPPTWSLGYLYLLLQCLPR